jgi:5'-deoxynucleotidase YfbR-like HD superfamily hydrolase
MKTNILWTVILLLSSTMAYAQSPVRDKMEEKREEINELKKEYIAQRINLNEKQEEKFWVIYDEYIEKKMRLKQQMARIRRQSDNLTATDEDLNTNIDKMFGLQQEELDLDKQSKTKLLTVINVRQLAELYRSEKEFIRRILQTLRGRNKNEGGQDDDGQDE